MWGKSGFRASSLLGATLLGPRRTELGISAETDSEGQVRSALRLSSAANTVGAPPEAGSAPIQRNRGANCGDRKGSIRC